MREKSAQKSWCLTFEVCTEDLLSPPAIGLELDSDLLRWSDGMSSSDNFFKKRAYCIKIEEESTTLLSNFHHQHLLGSTLSGDTPRSKTTLTNDPYRTNLPHSHLASCDP
jgi:hypothetical protein